MAQVETCSRCGAELVPGGNFCGSCGASVAQPEPPTAEPEPEDDAWVTFSGMPAVGSEGDEGSDPDPLAEAGSGAGGDEPSRDYPPVAPTVIGMPAIRFDEPPPSDEPVEEPQAQPDPEPGPEPEPEPRREEYEVAPTVLGMPAIVMPDEAADAPAQEPVPAAPADVAEEPAGDPDLDAELEAEIEAMRAAARAQEEEAQRQAEEAAQREAEEAAEREAAAAAAREAQEAAERAAQEAALREAEEAAAREAEDAAARAAEAQEVEDLEAAQAWEAEDAEEEAEAEVAAAEAELETAEEPEPAVEAAEAEAGVEAEQDDELELELEPEPAATEPDAEAVAAVRTADDHLGEAFAPYAVFRTHVGRLDEFVHLAAFDPAGRAADTLRRSGFVLLWTAFDAFVRDTLVALVERHPDALLAAADDDVALSYRELLELSDGLTSLDGLRAGLVARELDRLRGRVGSVRGALELLTETFGFQDAPLPAAYLVDEESRTLDADALQALEERRDALVHEDGASVTSEEFVDAEAALSTVAVKIAGTIAAGRYAAPVA